MSHLEDIDYDKNGSLVVFGVRPNGDALLTIMCAESKNEYNLISDKTGFDNARKIIKELQSWIKNNEH